MNFFAIIQASAIAFATFIIACIVIVVTSADGGSYNVTWVNYVYASIPVLLGGYAIKHILSAEE